MIGALVLFVALALGGFGAPARGQADAFDAGVAAYRRGDHAAATQAWTDLLAEPLSDAARAQVLYNLGNAAWRSGRGAEALGWYTAALRLAPRHADARANLAFAREELGLPPAEAGNLKATLGRLAGSATREQGAWLVIAASLVLLVALVGEALRGGRAWRSAVLLALALVALAAVPWISAERRDGGDPWMAIAIPSVDLRAEPREDLPAIGALAAGESAQRIDELEGWIRVETEDGLRAWAPESAMFPLKR